jgi:hypothetical protein
MVLKEAAVVRRDIAKGDADDDPAAVPPIAVMMQAALARGAMSAGDATVSSGDRLAGVPWILLVPVVHGHDALMRDDEGFFFLFFFLTSPWGM